MARKAAAARGKPPCDSFFGHSPTWRDFAIDIHHQFDEQSQDYRDFINSLEVLASIQKENPSTYKDYYFQYKSGSNGGFFAFDKLMRGYDEAHELCQGTPSGAFPKAP